MKRKDVSTDQYRADLTARLRAIVEAAATRALPRGRAGDLIATDVVGVLGAPKTVEDRALLRDAETARARLYLASGAKTPLDAATALLYAADYEAELPPDPGRAADTAPLARAVLDRLRPLRSKRRAFRVFAALADAVAVAPDRTGGAAALFAASPEYLDGAKRRFSPAAVGALLDKMQAAIRRDASLDPDVRDKLQSKLFRSALDVGDARRAADYWPGAAFTTPEDVERLAAAAAESERLDDALLGAVENALRLGDGPRSRLERPLRARASVGDATAEADLAGLEGLNRALAFHYADQPWPWKNLLRVAVRRGRSAEAFATFARFSEAASDLGDAPTAVAPLLLADGFRRLAAEFGDAATRLLAQAELALAADPRRASDELLGELERTFLDDSVPPILRNRAAQLRGRLAFAAGRPEEATGLLERALSCDPENAELSGDLAEVLAARGDFARALAFVQVALEAGEAPRLLELRSACLEAAGDVEGAADALKRALDLHLEHETDPPDDRRATRVAEAERAYARLGRRGPEFSPFLARLRADAETAAPAVRRGLERPEAARRRAAHLCDRADRPRDVLALLAPWRGRLATDEDLASLAARAAVALGRPEDALTLLQPFGPESDARVRTARGEALAALGRHAEAADELEAAAVAGDLERAGSALVRLELARGRPDAALARCAKGLADPGLPRPAAAALELMRAAAFEAKGDAHAALAACAASLERRESDAARARFARVATTAGLETDETYARAELLYRAVEAVQGVACAEANLWASIAAMALGRPAPIGPDEAADRLVDPSVDGGPGGRSRRIAGEWLRSVLVAPSEEPATACFTPDPEPVGTDTRAVGPFE